MLEAAEAPAFPGWLRRVARGAASEGRGLLCFVGDVEIGVLPRKA
jgi:hypothetical protein